MVQSHQHKEFIVLKPRTREGKRPACESVMPAAYFKRAYAARDCLDIRVRSAGDVYPVGHLDGGYCLDRVEPATGSHKARDFVYGQGN
jgi:hypothetical protein